MTEERLWLPSCVRSTENRCSIALPLAFPKLGQLLPTPNRRRTRSWRNWCAALSGVVVASLAQSAFAQQPPPAAPQRVTIGYVEVSGDPRYEPITGYGRLVLKSRERPFAGAQVGLDEAQALTRVLKTEFTLERISVASPAEVAPAVVQARDARGIHFFIVDAPADAFKPLAAATS